MFHEPRLPIVGLSADREVWHTVTLGMLQQILELLQNLIGLRVRYPTVLLNVRDAFLNRPVEQLACFRREMVAVHIVHSGSTMPSKASTRSAYRSVPGIVGAPKLGSVALGWPEVVEGWRRVRWRISRARRAFFVFSSDSCSSRRISSIAWKIRTSSTRA